ncbi:hypothetical protein VOLCADRAFT_88155 [Volvox carteri f. nagariensis]|uniref:Uncharacterized protein n=1 Tax=Volvox carteri f. nagariensis TaxID=3068 RepID=D8TNF2_VOLCA|nr:uncharacterized protein VOLCADRAFT_88155 [Volvox carteri f. nagariensis]EFJ50831.1 hypothetical protein VOLCADRAFT_88155 [Volvox carteri f. nagariensis]|eukprot:XP_002947843.1 hypothetical protein VOLCADRAFT_88155 [Volvox carteri f. nagariensis]
MLLLRQLPPVYTAAQLIIRRILQKVTVQRTRSDKPLLVGSHTSKIRRRWFQKTYHAKQPKLMWKLNCLLLFISNALLTAQTSAQAAAGTSASVYFSGSRYGRNLGLLGAWSTAPDSAFTAVWIGRLNSTKTPQTYLTMSRIPGEYFWETYWVQSSLFVFGDLGELFGIQEDISSPPAGQWTMDVFSRRPGATSAYHARYSSSGSLSLTSLTSKPCRLDRDNLVVGADYRDNNKYLVGNVAVLLIYNRSLSSSELLDLAQGYASRFGWPAPVIFRGILIQSLYPTSQWIAQVPQPPPASARSTAADQLRSRASTSTTSVSKAIATTVPTPNFATTVTTAFTTPLATPFTATFTTTFTASVSKPGPPTRPAASKPNSNPRCADVHRPADMYTCMYTYKRAPGANPFSSVLGSARIPAGSLPCNMQGVYPPFYAIGQQSAGQVLSLVSLFADIG